MIVEQWSSSMDTKPEIATMTKAEPGEPKIAATATADVAGEGAIPATIVMCNKLDNDGSGQVHFPLQEVRRRGSPVRGDGAAASACWRRWGGGYVGAQVDHWG